MKKNMPGIPESATTEESARAFLESILWKDGVTCPHCKAIDAYKMTPKAGSTRPGRKGLYRCRPCKRQFTVTVGTIFEGSHIPLHKWLMAVHLMTCSKKGISAHQLHRMLGITYKAAWFMAHRVRYAMKAGPLASLLKGKIEVDETYIGGKEMNKHYDKKLNAGRGTIGKAPVVALVQRNGGVRTMPVARVDALTLKDTIRQNVHPASTIFTDEASAYAGIGKEFKGGHSVVHHGAHQYVRGDAYTNTAESYFALLKRGVNGTFHHVSKTHLAHYCDEFAFRWNNRKASDTERALAALRGTQGKRLSYKSL